MVLRFNNPNHHYKNEVSDKPPLVRLSDVAQNHERTVAYGSLGKELRNVRQSKGLELSQISSNLKISKRYLAAIEEDNLEVLPLGKVYHIGFTRSYATYLGLNAAQCVEKLKTEIAAREAKHK